MARWWSAVLVAASLVGAPVARGQEEQPSPFVTPPAETPVFVEPPAEPARPHVDVGMGENTLSLFDDVRFSETGIRHVRLTVPYDVVKRGGKTLAATDAWLRSARDHGLEPLVSFGFSRRPGHRWRWHMPSVREYRARVREFRARFPWVREYTTWNEANHHRVQPSGYYPVRTAALYRELRRQCADGSCTAVAADVLLTRARRTWWWIGKFKRHIGRGPHIWGVHNYPDVNRHTGRLTKLFMRKVRGDIWFTETGGIVHFGRRWRRNEARASRAMRYVFRLAASSRRIKRVYIYNWRATKRNRRWDSGLISPAGRARDAYYDVLEALSRDRFRPPAAEPPPPEFQLPPTSVPSP